MAGIAIIANPNARRNREWPLAAQQLRKAAPGAAILETRTPEELAGGRQGAEGRPPARARHRGRRRDRHAHRHRARGRHGKRPSAARPARRRRLRLARAARGKRRRRGSACAASPRRSPPGTSCASSSGTPSASKAAAASASASACRSASSRRSTPAGAPGPATSTRLLARAFWSSLTAGPSRASCTRRWTCASASTTRNGRGLRFYGLVCSTVAEAGLGLRPFRRATEQPGAFQALGLTAGPRKFALELPRLLFGLPARRDRLLEGVGEKLELSGPRAALLAARRRDLLQPQRQALGRHRSPGLAGAHVILRNARTGAVLADRVQRASSLLARLRGLARTRALADGEGLLIERCNAIHTFFMRFAIDAVFLSRDLRVVRAIPELRPWRATRFELPRRDGGGTAAQDGPAHRHARRRRRLGTRRARCGSGPPTRTIRHGLSPHAVSRGGASRPRRADARPAAPHRPRHAAASAVSRGPRARAVRPRLLLGRGAEVLGARRRVHHRGGVRGRVHEEPHLPRGLLRARPATPRWCWSCSTRRRSPTRDLLRTFWESHDPTQGMRQGNDVGTPVPVSAIYPTTPAQRARRRSRARRSRRRCARPATARSPPRSPPSRPFYYAEDYHQQYLAKNPGGYCGLGGTGVSCPRGVSRLRSDAGFAGAADRSDDRARSTRRRARRVSAGPRRARSGRPRRCARSRRSRAGPDARAGADARAGLDQRRSGDRRFHRARRMHVHARTPLLAARERIGVRAGSAAAARALRARRGARARASAARPGRPSTRPARIRAPSRPRGSAARTRCG